MEGRPGETATEQADMAHTEEYTDAVGSWPAHHHYPAVALNGVRCGRDAEVRIAIFRAIDKEMEDTASALRVLVAAASWLTSF